MNKKKISFLTGAGISANAGISTYRDTNGLWTVEEFAKLSTEEAYYNHREEFIEFYNNRRRELKKVETTEAHKLIKSLEDHFEINIVTQNVDDLHEKAGSTNVTHYHGELFRMCNAFKSEVLPYNDDIKVGDLASDGTQLRPHVVLFGESIKLDTYTCEQEVRTSDYIVVIGTSLQVYPFANMVMDLDKYHNLIFIDKNDNEELTTSKYNVTKFIMDADSGMNEFIKYLQEKGEM